MCPPNPFPLAPTCAHTHDQLDRALTIFLINNDKALFSIRTLYERVLLRIPNYPRTWFVGDLQLLGRRLNLLQKEGFVQRVHHRSWTTTPGSSSILYWKSPWGGQRNPPSLSRSVPEECHLSHTRISWDSKQSCSSFSVSGLSAVWVFSPIPSRASQTPPSLPEDSPLHTEPVCSSSGRSSPSGLRRRSNELPA